MTRDVVTPGNAALGDNRSTLGGAPCAVDVIDPLNAPKSVDVDEALARSGGGEQTDLHYGDTHG